jgi:predicted MFS family arabinose efflux permease
VTEVAATGSDEAEALLADAAAAVPPKLNHEYWQVWWLLGFGWLGANLGYAIYDLPLKFLLKNQLHLGADALALFFAIGKLSNYVKPVVGIFTDAIPVFGTRRHHYLLLSLFGCGLAWLLLGWMPREYTPLLAAFMLVYVGFVFHSTAMGGVMVEAGERYGASGRLSAQRIGIFRIVAVIGGPVGGWLATHDFAWTCVIVAVLHFLLIPLFYTQLREPRIATTDFTALRALRNQVRVLFTSRTLWSAAGLVFLIELAPGFNTPLFYYQTEVLHFTPGFLGWLKLVGGGCGLLGAVLFNRLCPRFTLRHLLILGIFVHALAALLHLRYRDAGSAILISALYEAAQTLALLPLYDLSMRATPKGSESLGYCLMMSIWNIALALSDVWGARMFSLGVTFNTLVWLNAGTTVLVLLALPILPRALTDRRDGERGGA